MFYCVVFFHLNLSWTFFYRLNSTFLSLSPPDISSYGYRQCQFSGAAGLNPSNQSGHSCAEAGGGAAPPVGDPAWLLLGSPGEGWSQTSEMHFSKLKDSRILPQWMCCVSQYAGCLWVLFSSFSVFRRSNKSQYCEGQRRPDSKSPLNSFIILTTLVSVSLWMFQETACVWKTAALCPDPNSWCVTATKPTLSCNQTRGLFRNICLLSHQDETDFSFIRGDFAKKLAQDVFG